MTDTAAPTPSARVPTGIPGLDGILHGGLMRPSVTIVQGSPGAGKTVLGNQFAFHQASQGGRVLYLTLLSESHGRLLAHLSSMHFYDASAVASRVRYVSGFDTLEREGVKGVLRLLAAEARSLQADAIVLDGLFVLEENAESTRDFRKFVNALSLQAEVMDCTMLLLTNSARKSTSPEYTMVDGWIELSRALHEYRSDRTLQVHKQRGSGFEEGLHTLRISDAGLEVLARIETLAAATQVFSGGQGATTTTGNAQLDGLLGGGLREGSTTLVLGPAGVGKTTLGLQFLASCGEHERALAFGFYERPDRLLAKAAALELDLQGCVERGVLHLLWNPPTEAAIDELGHQLLDTVRRHRVRRLLVDGIEGFRQVAVFRSRISPFLTALANALRAEGCTTVFTMEVPQLFGRPSELQLESISAVSENVLLMRYIEQEHCLHRALSIIKVRDRGFDPAAREFHIGSGGLRIGGKLSSAPMDAAG